MKKLKSPIRSLLVSAASVCLPALVCCGSASAQEPELGYDLIGGDLTDPEDDADPEFDDGYDATFASSEEEGFAGGEFAFNVFDNVVGGGNDKWCCGSDGTFPDEPLWVQATFDLPYVLTSFSIASANDTPDRDPIVWEIQGSNDGENFTTIFRQEDDFAIWDDRLQVAVYEAGDDYDEPEAYSTIRFVCEETLLTGGARFQLAELEFFGVPGDTSLARFLRLTKDSVNSVTFELIDGDETTVDPDSIQLTIDDAVVAPEITKEADVTKVFYMPDAPFAEGSEHTYELVAKDDQGNDIGNEGSFTTATPAMPLEGIPGPQGTATGWGLRQIWNAGTVNGLADAIAIALDPDGDVSDTTVNAINFGETGNPGGGGLFLDDEPLPAEEEGLTTDDFIIVGHINVEHAGGDLTIGTHTDDGFGMRLIGGEFSEVYGAGRLDANFPQIVTHAANTGDSNTRAVARGLAAGVYTLEVIAWERGGGAYFEFYAAAGDFEFDEDSDWFLIGDPDGPLVPRIVTGVDSDEDGMSDSYEEANGLDPDVDDAEGDLDEDGLTNKQEHDIGTKPNNPDSDGDTLPDGVETNTGTYVDATNTGTNPTRSDTDRDGLPDNVETNTGIFVSATDRGTDPHKADTDGDRWEDGRDTDPLDPSVFPIEPPLSFELLGMDLTDPEDDGDPEFDDNYNAVFDASEEPDFAGGESAFNVFDNIVGGNNDKWCCGDQGAFPDEPIWVQATFETAIVLSHFTIASANDTPGRDPTVWEIQGSNDGENFTTIFRQDDPGNPIWDARLQVAEFSSGVHYDPPAAYTTIRFTCFETSLTGGARFQVGELEFFGGEGTVQGFQITKVERISRDGQEILAVTFPSTPTGTYAIETSTDLEPLNWAEIEDGFESEGTETTYEYILPAEVPAELYIRVREE